MRPRKNAWVNEFYAKWNRRKEAIAAGCVGLVPVCCGECGRPIATTLWSRKQGEPAILYDFPEDAGGWTCTECAGPFTVNPKVQP